MKEKTMMKSMKSIIVVVLVAMVLFAATANAGLVYAYTDQANRIFTVNADLSGESTVIAGYDGFVDMAVSADGIYFANSNKVFRTDLDGSNLTYTAANGAETVACYNGLVYVYSDQSDRIFTVNADLSGESTVAEGYGGMVDMAVSAEGIYFANGSKVWRTDLDGSNLTSTSVNGAETVAFYNGLVYAYTDQADRIFTVNADLSDESTVAAGYGGFVDMAVSADGIYFASGSKVWRTELDGTSITSTGVNGAETVAIITHVPAPATMILLGVGGLMMSLCKKR